MINEKRPAFKVRLIFGVVLLIASFIGMMLTEVRSDGGWTYWRVIVPCIAIFSLWVTWYVGAREFSWSLIWKEIVHWLGLICAVYLVTYYVGSGVLGRFEASLMVITLLALTLFLAGIYFEPVCLVLGPITALFGLGAALFAEYIYSVFLPLAVLATGLIIWVVSRRKKEGDDKRNQ